MATAGRPLTFSRMSSHSQSGTSASAASRGTWAAWNLLTLDLRFEEYLEFARTGLGHSPATVHTCRYTFRRFRAWLLTLVSADDAPLGDAWLSLDGWVRWLRAQGIGAITVNTYWRTLRPFFRQLERTHGVPNPYTGAKAPSLPSRIPKAWSRADCSRILKALQNYPGWSDLVRARNLALVATVVYAGLRRGELLRLEFRDVNLVDGTLTVVRGKGRAGGKDRVVYLPRELLAILKAYDAQRRRLGLTGPEFYLRRTGAALSVMMLRRIQVAGREAAQIPWTWHSLRHSFVTLLLQGGIPLHVVRDLAGHADIATTLGYTRVWDDEKRAYMAGVSLR